MHELRSKISLDIPVEHLWAFIATPKNLNLLTPEDLDFRIISDLPEQMYSGLTILYRIRIPFFGTHRWLTEIKHIREGISFVDEQRLGPYRLWYHYHEVRSLTPSKSEMVDYVTYSLPFGPLGTMIHKLKVRQMLSDIFAYRHKKLLELFPPKTATVGTE